MRFERFHDSFQFITLNLKFSLFFDHVGELPWNSQGLYFTDLFLGLIS